MESTIAGKSSFSFSSGNHSYPEYITNITVLFPTKVRVELRKGKGGTEVPCSLFPELTCKHRFGRTFRFEASMFLGERDFTGGEPVGRLESHVSDWRVRDFCPPQVNPFIKDLGLSVQHQIFSPTCTIHPSPSRPPPPRGRGSGPVSGPRGRHSLRTCRTGYRRPVDVTLTEGPRH